LLKDEEGVEKLTPREHCIQRIRVNIARRIRSSLAHPDQLNERRRRQRERRRRRKLKGGDDDDGAGEGDETVARDGDSDGEDGTCHLESILERDIRIDLTREAMALELGTLGRFG
jgi:hypothetical protein